MMNDELCRKGDLEKALKDMMKRRGIKSYMSTVFDGVDFETLIDEVPVVEAEPVQHGHWVIDKRSLIAAARSNGKQWVRATCSVCNVDGSPRWKRCLVCETKMDEEEESNG